ncbi:MAG: Panacea domain-containing protein [Bacteroidota bacterium]
MMTDIQKQKIEQLLIHLIHALQDSKAGVTKTKLYKLLYFLDFGHYAKYDRSITNLSYLKFRFGPVPMGVDTLLKLMEENEWIQRQWKSDRYDGHSIYKSSTVNPSNDWSATEKETIEATIQHFKNTYAFQVSRETHHHYSWISTDNGKIIDYEKSKFCDFEWLDYFYNKTKEEYLEDQQTRKLLDESEEMDQLMNSLQNL